MACASSSSRSCPHVYPLPDGLNLTPVMSMRALHENLVMVEEPIPTASGWGAPSSASWRRYALRPVHRLDGAHYNPVRPLGMIGLAAPLLAAAIGLGLIFVRAQGVHSITPTGALCSLPAWCWPSEASALWRSG
ncbi:MAG: hypothetical protein R2851_20135 [Caldilineaceae bacterium]